MFYWKIAALVVPMQVTLLIYAHGILDVLPEWLSWIGFIVWAVALLLLGPFILMLDFANPMFVGPLAFFLGYALSILAGIFLIATTRHRPAIMRMAAVTTCLIAIAPFVLSPLYGDYYIYVSPVDGHQLRWLTEPENRFQSAFKSAQRRYETVGCRYSLLGWGVDNQVYFESSCRSTTWQYNPTDDTLSELDIPLPMSQTATDVVRITGSIDSSPLEGVTHSDYPFKTLETSGSANGQWTAAVIANYYGPMDVIVVSLQASNDANSDSR